VTQVRPTDVAKMMKHRDQPRLTPVTCKGYDVSTGDYRCRILVEAVLVEVK